MKNFIKYFFTNYKLPKFTYKLKTFRLFQNRNGISILIPIFLWTFISVFFSFAQDLWDDDGEIFTDQKVKPLGSVVYIRFEEPVIASFNSSYQKIENSQSSVLNTLPQVLSFLPLSALNNSKQKNVEREYQISEQITGVLAGTIVRIDRRAKTYTINARHNWNIDGEPFSISFSGLVNQKDLEKNNYISSKKIANSTINLLGKSFKTKTNWREEDFTNLKFPSSISNAIDLNDTEKKKLYLEIFNLILNELF